MRQVKEAYERTKLTVTEFKKEDVIVTSGVTPLRTVSERRQRGLRMV